MDSPIPRTEHISLEVADSFLTTATPRLRKVRQKFALRSRLCGCTTEIALFEDHFLSVRTVRPDTEPKKYDIDLRFANPKPVLIRHIAWFWLTLAVAFVALSAGALWLLWPRTAVEWLTPVPLTALAALPAAFGAAFMFLRRTTESLQFSSAHGAVTLLSVTGGIGSARDGKKFFIELIKNIQAAKAERQSNRAQYLRDEMREHHRLRELGALTQDQYEAAKTRILAAH